MVVETSGMQVAFLIGRLFYGIVLAFMGLNHFMNTDEMADHARSNGVPLPKISVMLTGLMLIFGGLSIALGTYTFLGSLLIVIFFAVVTPEMHAFWDLEGEERHQQMIHFLKNILLLGSALVFLSISPEVWPYAIGALF